MLIHKMFRELKADFGQFLSLFILSFLATSLFACMKSSNIGGYRAWDNFNEETNVANGWMYGEGFTQENLDAVKALSDVDDALRRMHITASSAEQNGAQLEVFLEDENIISKPYLMEGKDFDPSDADSIWISQTFADCWNLKVGDDFAFLYNGIRIEKKIAGLIAAPEYPYLKADADVDIVLENIAVVYMAYRGFPAKEYVKELIRKGDITVSDVLERTDALDDVLEKLEALGMTKEDITSDLLLERVDAMSEDRIFGMLPYTELVFTTHSEHVKSMEEELAEAVDDNYAVFIDADMMPGIKPLQDELIQHDQFSYLFTVVFLLIALLVIMTTMSRMVEKQRTQIGTMNALGMKRIKITLHYLSFSFLISAAGSILGMLIGTYGLGAWLAWYFAKWYVLPGWGADWDASFIAVILLVVLVCTAAAYFSCRKLLRINPAETLRPAPPKAGKRCLFEKLPFWNRLGFTSQYNLRDISRAKLRAFMGMFGTACGMILMICAFACNTTINNVYEWNFSKLQNFDYEVDFDEDITPEEADALADRYDGELVMADSIEVAAKPHAVSDEKRTTAIYVIEGKGLYGVTDAAQNVTSVKEGTVALTTKLADGLDLKVGDTVYWHHYKKNTWYSAEIGLINRIPTGSGITMLRTDYESTGDKFRPSALYTDEDVSELAGNHEAVLAVHTSDEMLKAYQTAMAAIDIMVGVFAAFASILPIVVLYNCGNLSFHERVKEFATLKVLGFASGQIRHLLTVQNLWLSVIGVLLGAPFGRLLLQYMFDSNGDSFDYAAVASVTDYLFAGAFVLLISVLVSFLFSKRIRQLDMVEVLKGME
ncbi:MAG: ABC transporter permease [Lachnospiraceae bacterium]|nr:ABC transporter permease [Lachnospiraceae bacterium]